MAGRGRPGNPCRSRERHDVRSLHLLRSRRALGHQAAQFRMQTITET
jgi:hypothetical protein